MRAVFAVARHHTRARQDRRAVRARQRIDDQPQVTGTVEPADRQPAGAQTEAADRAAGDRRTAGAGVLHQPFDAEVEVVSQRQLGHRDLDERRLRRAVEQGQQADELGVVLGAGVEDQGVAVGVDHHPTRPGVAARQGCVASGLTVGARRTGRAGGRRRRGSGLGCGRTVEHVTACAPASQRSVARGVGESCCGSRLVRPAGRVWPPSPARARGSGRRSRRRAASWSPPPAATRSGSARRRPGPSVGAGIE